MKKTVLVFLVLVIVISVFAVPITANANVVDASQIYAQCDGFEYTVLSDGTAQITDYHGFEEKVIIPSVLDGYTVTSIGKRAFSYEQWPAPASVGIAQTRVSRFAKITEVTIPDTVTSIEDYAFIYCENLTGIIIPNSVKSIGGMAFAYCDSLSYLVIGSSLQNIGTNAFSSCESLESIFVYENNEVYDSRDYCNAVIETSTNTLVVGCKTTVIPESVTSIGDYAFYNKGLDRANIPDSVTSIGEYAFAYNKNLYGASISSSVKSLEKGVFSNCESLKYLTIGNSVQSIGDYAFSECKNLSYVIISNSVESIGKYAFYKCKNLKDVIIVDSVKSIGEYAFFGCTSLMEITIPKSVTSIGKRAFGYIFDGENEKYVVIDGVTIYGYKNTETQRYANDNGIKFVLLGNEPESEIGDVDGDGEITVIDASCVQSHVAQLIIIADDRIAFADANKDGVISIMDATMIQRFVAQLIDSL